MIFMETVLFLYYLYHIIHIIYFPTKEEETIEK